MSYVMPSPEIQGWMSPEELNWLYETAKTMQSIVEVGSWRGRSTHALLSGCPGRVIAVDHFKGSLDELNTEHRDAKTQDIHAQFTENLRRFPELYAKLAVLRFPSVEAASGFDRKVDMVFIDGCHELRAVASDLKAWRPHATKLLCGHDWAMEGVQGALAETGLMPFVDRPVRSGNGIWSIDMEKLNAITG